MNRKKLLLILCSFIFLLVISIVSVEALGGSAGQSSGGPAAGCTNGWCWQDLEAIRISFYHKDGTKVGKSLNFYNSNQSIVGETYDFRYNNYLNTSFYTTGLNWSKYDYIDKNTYLENYSQWPSLSFSSFFTGGIPFERNLYETGQAKNVFDEKLGLNGPDAIKEKIIDTGYESYFELGISLQRIISSENYYMIVEPITILKNSTGKLYIGTYYELQQIYNSVTDKNFGEAKSLFRTSGSWGDAKFAMSIYLSEATLIDGEGRVKDTLDSIRHNTDFTSVNNAYGIGTLWFGNYRNNFGCDEYSEDWNPTTGNCEPIIPTPDIETCKVLEPVVDPCNDRIVYEYQNCSTSGYAKVEYSGYTICDIQCNEKYYVATWPTVNTFNPISETGILAGSYIQGIGPTVYHKKTCNYVIDEDKLDQIVEKKIESSCRRSGVREILCPGTTTGEMCTES